MISVDIISKIVNKSTGKSATMVGGESNIDLSAYLLKEIWEKVWEIKTDEAGNEYIFGKLPVVTQYGVTMYADNGSLDIPSIYAGLPIDNNTLVRDTNGVLMINPNLDLGGGGGASSWDELEGIPSWIGATKPTYEYSEIKNTPDLSKYVSSDELKKFVTLDGNETITGEKNFTGGLKVNGIPIDKSQDDVLYIDGNLVVRGGVTMYGENEVDIPTLMDAIAVDATMYNEGGILGVVKASTTKAGAAMFDSNFFSVDDNGLVTLTNAPSSVSTLGSLLNVDVSLDSTATVNRVLYQAAGSSTWTWKELTSSGVTGDYLPLSGGQMTGDIGIPLTPGTRTIGVPAAGSYDYSISTYDDLPTHRSFIGTVYNTSSGKWWNVISCRHRNGDGDGRQYGMYITTNLTDTVSDLQWARQHYDGWQEERTILDTYNWRDHVMQNGTLDVIGGSTLGNFPAIRFVIHNTNWSQFVMGTDGIIWLVGGSNQDAIYSGRAGLITGYLRGTSILSDGGITMYSDIRKKTKLQDVELSLSQIANAPLIEHFYNSDDKKTTHVGSIAQYWAGLNDWFCKLDNEGYYTMEIQNAALASAISIARHLEKYESKTDKKIRQLKKRISQLEDKIELLKKGA